MATAATVSDTATASPTASPTAQYIVRAVPGQLASLDATLRTQGTVVRQIALIDADVVTLNATNVARLAADPRVASITRNSMVTLAGEKSKGKGKGKSESRQTTTLGLNKLARQIGAQALRDGVKAGDGVDVAIIDSGVSPIDGLDGDKVVNGPDLSFDSQNDDTRYTDGYGHGTHLAGIIAGDSEDFQGIAPNARIVSVKVADRRGMADVSQVIAGIEWVVSHAKSNNLNVRVLNLSFGTDSEQAYQLDPLAFAAERAWHAGIVVVASTGNDGSRNGRLTNPAIDPYILAVGAADTTKRELRVADFSGRGNAERTPDLVAPGAHIASLQPRGTEADKQFGSTARQSNGLFLGSGTSQAAAVTSGAAALLLAERPELTPDQVKALLTGTANPLSSADKKAQGAGLIDVGAAALAPAPTAVQSFPRSTGTGSLEASRGSIHVAYEDKVLSGEVDIFGQAWTGNPADLAKWSSETLTSTNWGAVAWGSTNWGSTNWGSSNWAATNWAATNWAATNWAATNWAGSNWAATNWAGSNWAATNWG